MNNQRYTYSGLGESCQTSFAVLTDARKFLPMNNPEYEAIFTKTYEYPTVMREKYTSNANNTNDIQSNVIPKEKIISSYGSMSYPSSCCGNKKLYGI